MDVNTITTLVSTLGFPIVVCIALGFYVVRRDNLHKAEIDKLSEAVSATTQSIQQLVTKLDTIISMVTKQEGE